MRLCRLPGSAALIVPINKHANRTGAEGDAFGSGREAINKPFSLADWRIMYGLRANETRRFMREEQSPSPTKV